MRLKDYLEATGMIEERDLVDAENRAQIYGGSLDTALLELEVLDPVRLDAALAAARGLLSSPPELLLQAPRRRPWEMLPEIWIDEREAVPLAFIEDRLWVALHPDVTEEAIASVQHRLPGAALTVTAECWIWTIADQYRRTPTPPRYSLLAAGYVRAILGARQALVEESLTADVAGVHETFRDDGFHVTDDDDETPVSSDMPEETASEDASATAEARAEAEDDDAANHEPGPGDDDDARLETPSAGDAADAADAAEGSEVTTPDIAADTGPDSDAPPSSPAPSEREAPAPVTAATPLPTPVIPGLRRSAPSPSEAAPSPPRHALGELPPFIPALVQPATEVTPPPADAPPPAIPSLRRSAREERTVIPALGRRPEATPTIPSLTRAPTPAPAPTPREADAPLAATIPALTRTGSQPSASAGNPPGASAPEAAAPPLETRIPDLKRPPSQPSELDAPRPRPAPERAPGYVPPTLVHRQAQPASTDATTIDALVSAAIAAGGRRETHAQRLRAIGAAAFLRIAQLFPGPLDLPRGDLRSLPSASAHGPLLRLCIALGEAITPYVLARLDDPDPNVRFYGALLFQELRSPSAVLPLARLAFDPDRDVRMIAMRVLETYHGAPSYADAVAELRAEIGEGPSSRRQQAIHAMGTLRDAVAVPLLIDALDHDDLELRGAALTALCSISGQHLGMASERWRAWYREKGGLSRVEWMIESLGHRDPAVRKWASEELLRITGHAIQFDPRGDEASREAAIERWRAWWSARKG